MPAQAGIHGFLKTTKKPNDPNHLTKNQPTQNNPEHSTSMHYHPFLCVRFLRNFLLTKG
jgi:hypothetical protein